MRKLASIQRVNAVEPISNADAIERMRVLGCPCGSGKKLSGSTPDASPAKYPIGTVAHYGPDAKRTTKIVAGVILRDGAEAIIVRLQAAVSLSADWFAVPKFMGRLADLGTFALEWCAANGFTVEK